MREDFKDPEFWLLTLVTIMLPVAANGGEDKANRTALNHSDID